MAKTFTMPGSVLEWTNGTGSDVSSGDPVPMGDVVGIALVDIADGDSGNVAVEGVWQVTKATGTAWAVGNKVDWDASAGAFDLNVTPASGDVEDCGVAAMAAESADTVGYLKLTPGTGSAA